MPTIASDLSIDMADAGLLITGYAVGIAVGGPILTFTNRRMAKAMVLVVLMVGFGPRRVRVTPLPRLYISAFNVGIAAGSFLGTAVVARGGLSVTPFVAAGLSPLAIIPDLLGSRRATVSGSAPGLPAVPAPVPVPTE